MVTKNVRALELANWYYDMVRHETKFDKQEAVRDLAKFKVFTAREIAMILDRTIDYVVRYGGPKTEASHSNRVWKVGSLSSLWLAAEAWAKGETPEALLRLLTDHGTSVKAICELTGIPREVVGRVVYGESMLGIFESGAYAKGR